MIDQTDVKEAERLAQKLQRKLRELYVQGSMGEADADRDAKMTMTGMMRGIFDFINYCKSGE